MNIHFVYALLVSIVPAFLWLWFWLKEDRLHPEPRMLILLAFLGGMLAVPLVLPFEQFVNTHLSGGAENTVILALWAFIEEFGKYLVAFVFVLRRRAVDEPLDPIIYMITVAIGFAVLENAFFLTKSIAVGDTVRTIINSDMRFMGAELLHIVASAFIGLSIALPFYKRRFIKEISLLVGIIAATALHTGFNYFITHYSADTFNIFLCVWAAVVVLMIFFEEVKRIVPSKGIQEQGNVV